MQFTFLTLAKYKIGVILEFDAYFIGWKLLFVGHFMVPSSSYHVRLKILELFLPFNSATTFVGNSFKFLSSGSHPTPVDSSHSVLNCVLLPETVIIARQRIKMELKTCTIFSFTDQFPRWWKLKFYFHRFQQTFNDQTLKFITNLLLLLRLITK